MKKKIKKTKKKLKTRRRVSKETSMGTLNCEVSLPKISSPVIRRILPPISGNIFIRVVFLDDSDLPQFSSQTSSIEMFPRLPVLAADEYMMMPTSELIMFGFIPLSQ